MRQPPLPTDPLIDWDDAFDNSGYVAGSELLADRWSNLADTFRSQLQNPDQAEMDIAYGPLARNRLDLFRPETDAKGLILYVHGGYWHQLDKSIWSHCANGALQHDWAFTIPSYTLAPQARIGEITREIAAAIETAAARVRGPIRLIGHSAGGHLVARMMDSDSMLRPATRQRLQKVVAVSGIFDLRPLLHTRMNDVLQLDSAEAESESPVFTKPLTDVEVIFWVGAAERPEFLRQTRNISESWGHPVMLDVYEAGKNHFSVIEGLSDPDSALTMAITGATTGASGDRQ